MSAVDTKAENQKKILIVMVTIFTLYLDFSYVFKAQNEGLKRVGGQVAKLKDDINVLQADLKNMQAAKAKQALPDQNTSLPSGKIIPAGGVSKLLEEVADLANKQGVTILQMRPAPQGLAGTDKADVLFINLEVSGGYHALGRFIYGLENNDSFISVAQFKITAQPATYPKQRITLILKTYVAK